jgi:steroid 5-alpha reductase family enzyme
VQGGVLIEILPIAASLAAPVALACVTWALSVHLRDVSIVDIAWGLLVLSPAVVIAALRAGPRAPTVLLLAAAWALRLGGYIAWRHRGQPEDRRYQEIRRRNEPHFAWKSLYLVFALQAVLAWIVSAPIAAAAASPAAWTALDEVGIAVVTFGLLFETIADAQLARFRRQRESGTGRGKRIMDTGLWRYSRHPNYFGECCLWWGFWLVALAAGAGWTIVSPLLMTVLLLRVSGVTLLEKHLASDRPGYDAYVRRTSAFIPWRPRP